MRFQGSRINRVGTRSNAYLRRIEKINFASLIVAEGLPILFELDPAFEFFSVKTGEIDEVRAALRFGELIEVGGALMCGRTRIGLRGLIFFAAWTCGG